MIDLDKINANWADAICRGRRRGDSWQTIADELGVNRGSVYRFAKRYDMHQLTAEPQTGFRPLGRFELMHPFERRGLEKPGQEGMFDDEIAADNAARAAAKAAAEAEEGRGELSDDDFALIDDAVAEVDMRRFENLVVGLPWTEPTAQKDVVAWIEENVTVVPSSRRVANLALGSLMSRGAEREAAADRLIADDRWDFSLPNAMLWALCGLVVATAIAAAVIVRGAL